MKKVLIMVALLSVSASGMAADAVAGKAKYSAVCVACHGVNGKASVAGAKDISGKSAKYIAERLAAFKAGTVKTPMAAVMAPMAAMLSAGDIKNVAAHIATLK